LGPAKNVHYIRPFSISGQLKNQSKYLHIYEIHMHFLFSTVKIVAAWIRFAIKN